MQSLFVLLRITIFRKTFISPLANENFVFSKQIPHVTIKMKIHRISKRTTDDKIPHMPQNKIPPAGITDRFQYPARLNQKFRHPTSPAKGFRIFSQAGKFPYFDLFPRPRILIPHRPTSTFIPPYPSGSSDIPPHPPKVSAFFPNQTGSRIPLRPKISGLQKKHLHPLRMEVFRLFKLPITQQQKYLLQLCIRPCVPTGCVFP